MQYQDNPRGFGTNQGPRYTNNYGHNAVGMFRDRSSAECALDKLMQAGYSRDRISMVMRESEDTKKWAEGYGVKTNKVGEGAAVGAGTGGILGGIAGFLAGLGLLAIPGVGPLLAAGPIASAIGGAVAGGAAGGLLGALVGLGIPENEAKYYQEDVMQGGIMVVAQCDGPCENAYRMFRECGATNFDNTTNLGTSNTGGFGTAPGFNTGTNTGTSTGTSTGTHHRPPWAGTFPKNESPDDC